MSENLKRHLAVEAIISLLFFGMVPPEPAAGQIADYTFASLDFPGASETAAIGLNDGNEVVGYYRDRSTSLLHGFRYSKGTFTTIDYPEGFPKATDTRAYGINNVGNIVGAYVDARGLHGFLATR